MKNLIVCLSVLISTSAFALVQPDHKLTPGRAESKLTTQVICTPAYVVRTAQVPSEVQTKVFQRYQTAPSPTVAIDNLVDQGLGGSQSDVRNLWPQDVCPAQLAGKTCFGFAEKNVVDQSLHQRVCAGQISLTAAQAIDRGDWVSEYKKLTAQSGFAVGEQK